jgi:diguanylate cyclase (GGDEF)-like protein
MESGTLVAVAILQSLTSVTLLCVCVYLLIKLDKAKGYAYLSSVSGLPNKLGIERSVRGVFARLQRGKIQKVTVVAIDLDQFKPINDVYGHKNGDKVLKTAGDILLRSTRPDDVVGHLSGDEFVIIFSDTEESHVEEILARAKEKFRAHHFSFTNGNKVQTNFTYGIASSVRNDASFESLCHSADMDCNRRKELVGGSRFRPTTA